MNAVGVEKSGAAGSSLRLLAQEQPAHLIDIEENAPERPIERYPGILKRRDVPRLATTRPSGDVALGGEPQMGAAAPARKRIPWPRWMQTVN